MAEWFGKKVQSPTWTAVIITLAGVVVMGVLLVWASTWYQRQLVAERRAEAALEVSLRGNVITSILTRRFARLQGLYAYTLAEPSLENLEANFESFASTLYVDSSGIRNFSIAPGGVVSEVYPVSGNEAVIGYSPLDDPRPDIRADALLAIETGEIIVSGPVALIEGGNGIIARQAVFKNGGFWGFVNLVIDLSALLNEAGVDAPGDMAGGNLEFALRDGRGDVIFGPPFLFEEEPVLNTIELPEGVWELAAYPPNGWQTAVREPLLLFWIAGLLIVSLVVSLIYLSVNRQARLTLAVQHRTQELSDLNSELVQSHQMLEERVQERTTALRSLFDVSNNLASNLELQPLLKVILDQLERVIGYTSVTILLLGDDGLETAAQRGIPSPHLDELISGNGNNDPEANIETILFNHWQSTGDAGPIRNNFNNPLTPQNPPAQLDTRPDLSWMSIPLKYHDRLIGMILLTYRDYDYYRASHEQVGMVIANQSAVTIENARLFQQGRHLAVLQERQRLARELHDSVSQALYGIALGAKTSQALLKRDPLKVSEPLDYILSLSEAALDEMRALIFELRPESLEKEGLLAAIEKQAQVLRSRFGLHVQVNWEMVDEPLLALPIKEVLYRVTQEATHNITKHAAAKNVEIHIYQEEQQIYLEIKDDGKGFDSQGSFPGHLGLRSMQERVEQVGGSLVIDSQPGEGSCICANIPFK